MRNGRGAKIGVVIGSEEFIGGGIGSRQTEIKKAIFVSEDIEGRERIGIGGLGEGSILGLGKEMNLNGGVGYALTTTCYG